MSRKGWRKWRGFVAQLRLCIGFPLFEDAILMNTAGVSESLFANDRFAALDHKAAHAGNKARRFDDLACVHAGAEPFVNIASCFKSHHELLENCPTYVEIVESQRSAEEAA